MEHLRQLRAEAGISQDELGFQVDISGASIGAYETGMRYPDVKRLLALCQYFHVSADYMLDLTEIREGADAIVENKELTQQICALPADLKQYLVEMFSAYNAQNDKGAKQSILSRDGYSR